jgi:hypothetical protein
MKYNTIIFSCLLIYFLAPDLSLSKDNKIHLRTDGFYFYDNGIDTIVYIPGGEQMQGQMIEYMKQMGYIKPDFIPTHEDSLVKNGDSSTLIDVMVFFSDSTGTHIGTPYRKNNTLQELLNTIDLRKRKIPTLDSDKRVRFYDFEFQNDSTFTFTYAKNFPDWQSKYICTYKGNDTLSVKIIRPADFTTSRNYIFVPFNNIPNNLLKVKKK